MRRGTVVVLNPSPEPRVGLVELEHAAPAAFELPDGSLAATQTVGDGVVANVRVPPLGWVALRPVDGSGEVEHPVRAGEHELDNGLLAVAVGEDGTLDVGALRGVGRIVAGGDGGDSYNYAPTEDDTLVERPTFASSSSSPVRSVDGSWSCAAIAGKGSRRGHDLDRAARR